MTDDYEATPETRTNMARAIARQIADDPVALRTIIRAIANAPVAETAYLVRRIRVAPETYEAEKRAARSGKEGTR